MVGKSFLLRKFFILFFFWVWFCFVFSFYFYFLFFSFSFLSSFFYNLKGAYLGFCFIGVLGVAFLWMAPSLCSPSIQDTPCPHCYGLYTFRRPLKACQECSYFCSLVSQTSKVVLSLQVSFPHEFFPSFIPLASWGWLRTQSSPILRFFESCFACTHLFHKIPQAIQDKVKQAFHLPFDWIVWNPTNILKWFIFFLLYRCFLCYIQKGHSSQWKVSAHFRRFMVDD
jgi:hypothetical protein